MEVIIDNRVGEVWDVSELVSELTWKTNRVGNAGSVEFTLVKDGVFSCNNGDVVQCYVDGRNVFYGYVFSVDRGKDDAFNITAYDQLRYLMANDTYVLENVTATQVIRQICGDFGLRVGELADTRHKLSLVEDGKKLIDIILVALDRTLIATEKIYVLFDDFGAITLRDAEDMALDFVIGDRSMLHGWSHKSSIDSDTYNQIKLVRDNKDTGRRDVHMAQDSANIAKWGRLQLYQSVDEKMNAAQIDELLTRLIAIKNRETKTLKVDAIGDIRVRAGCYVPIQIEELGINQYFLVQNCSHKISGADHTMSLDLKVI